MAGNCCLGYRMRYGADGTSHGPQICPDADSANGVVSMSPSGGLSQTSLVMLPRRQDQHLRVWGWHIGILCHIGRVFSDGTVNGMPEEFRQRIVSRVLEATQFSREVVIRQH